MNLLTPQPFRFDWQGDSPHKDTPRDVNSDHKLSPHQPLGAKTAIDIEETRGSYHLSPLCCPQIVDLKAIGVWCQQPHWCHHCQTGQKAPGIPGEVDDMGKPKPTWKLIYLPSKIRMQRMLWPTKVGGGIWLYTIVQDAEIVHSSHMQFSPCRLPWRIGAELQDGYNLGWCVNDLEWTL